MKEAAQKIKEKYLEDKGGGVVSGWVWQGMSGRGRGVELKPVTKWNGMEQMSRMNRTLPRAKVPLCFEYSKSSFWGAAAFLQLESHTIGSLEQNKCHPEVVATASMLGTQMCVPTTSTNNFRRGSLHLRWGCLCSTTHFHEETKSLCILLPVSIRPSCITLTYLVQLSLTSAGFPKKCTPLLVVHVCSCPPTVATVADKLKVHAYVHCSGVLQVEGKV